MRRGATAHPTRRPRLGTAAEFLVTACVGCRAASCDVGSIASFTIWKRCMRLFRPRVRHPGSQYEEGCMQDRFGRRSRSGRPEEERECGGEC
jgi:hypothetical protein